MQRFVSFEGMCRFTPCKYMYMCYVVYTDRSYVYMKHSMSIYVYMICVYIRYIICMIYECVNKCTFNGCIYGIWGIIYMLLLYIVFYIYILYVYFYVYIRL